LIQSPTDLLSLKSNHHTRSTITTTNTHPPMEIENEMVQKISDKEKCKKKV